MFDIYMMWQFRAKYAVAWEPVLVSCELTAAGIIGRSCGQLSPGSCQLSNLFSCRERLGLTTRHHIRNQSLSSMKP